MAKFGCCYPCFVPTGATKGVVIGKLCSANKTVNNATGELGGDNEVCEKMTTFASASVAVEVDNLSLQTEEVLLGATYDETENALTNNKSDTAPQGTLAYYQTIKNNGVVVYRVIQHNCATASKSNDNVTTKGSSVTLQSCTLNFDVLCDANGDWEVKKEFTTELAAKTYINTTCKITA